jgi:hypothetical protein
VSGLAAAALGLSVLAVLGTASPGAGAGTIQFDGSPGTGAPPTTLGPYTMTKFLPDGRPLFANVTTVPAPNGGVVTLDRPLNHRSIGNGWSTWSNSYTGAVYCSSALDCTGGTPGPGERTVVMTLPANTAAFYFYAESDQFATFNFTATAQDGTTSGAVPVNGVGGAKYFGFFTTDLTNPLVTITVTTNANPGGFAVGQFGIAQQAPPPTTTTTTTAPPKPIAVVVTPRFTG